MKWGKKSKRDTSESGAVLARCEQNLASCRKTGDRAGEAVTAYNLAMLHRAGGNLARAIRILEVAATIEEQIGLPDLKKRPHPARINARRTAGAGMTKEVPR